MAATVRALIVDAERHARNHADPQPRLVTFRFPERADPEVRELELDGDGQFRGVVSTPSDARAFPTAPHAADQPQEFFGLRVSPDPAATKAEQGGRGNPHQALSFGYGLRWFDFGLFVS